MSGQQKVYASSDFSKKKKYDEAHLHLYGHLNMQNCRLWGMGDFHALHSQKVTVWCTFWSGGVIEKFKIMNYGL